MRAISLGECYHGNKSRKKREQRGIWRFHRGRQRARGLPLSRAWLRVYVSLVYILFFSVKYQQKQIWHSGRKKPTLHIWKTHFYANQYKQGVEPAWLRHLVSKPESEPRLEIMMLWGSVFGAMVDGYGCLVDEWFLVDVQKKLLWWWTFGATPDLSRFQEPVCFVSNETQSFRLVKSQVHRSFEACASALSFG